MLPVQIVLITLGVALFFCLAACGTAAPPPDTAYWETQKNMIAAKNKETMAKISPKMVAKINEMLDKVNTKKFFFTTADASGHNVVILALLDKQEMNFLVQESSTVIPIMLERLNDKKGVEYESSLIVYFYVFMNASYVDAIPYIASYIKSLPETERQKEHSPWHPFRYSMGALTVLMGQKIDPYYAYKFNQRFEVVKQAKEWYENHKKE